MRSAMAGSDAFEARLRSAMALRWGDCLPEEEWVHYGRESGGLSAMQATLMARIEKEAKDSRSIQDTLAAQMQSLQDRLHNAEMTGSSANTFMTDLQMLAQDFATRSRCCLG
eukprot:s2067_g3.t1